MRNINETVNFEPGGGLLLGRGLCLDVRNWDVFADTLASLSIGHDEAVRAQKILA